jgi:hypothetical protein
LSGVGLSPEGSYHFLKELLIESKTPPRKPLLLAFAATCLTGAAAWVGVTAGGVVEVAEGTGEVAGVGTAGGSVVAAATGALAVVVLMGVGVVDAWGLDGAMVPWGVGAPGVRIEASVFRSDDVVGVVVAGFVGAGVVGVVGVVGWAVVPVVVATGVVVGVVTGGVVMAEADDPVAGVAVGATTAGAVGRVVVMASKRV